MIFKILFVVGLLGSCSASGCAGGNNPSVFRQLTLCEEFQLIRDLAPHDSVIQLVKSHMQNDLRFRKAADYMRSSAFKTTTAKIDSTTTYKRFLRQFTRAGVNTTDIDSVFDIFNCVLIPIIEEATAASYRSVSLPSKEMVESRSMSTFAQSVSRLINTDDLIETLKTQIDNNKQFAEFYKIIRNPTFHSNVMKGFTNSDVASPIKTLRHRQISLPELTEYGFRIFNNGPAVDD